MSGIIGISPNMRSGVVGQYPTGDIIKTEYTSQQYQGAIITSQIWFTQTLSGYKVGDKCLITVCGYAMMGVAGISNYFHVYLSSNDANSGLGQSTSGERILYERGRYATLWDAESFSYTFLTSAVSSTAPTYGLHTAESGTATIYLSARFTFQQIQG